MGIHPINIYAIGEKYEIQPGSWAQHGKYEFKLPLKKPNKVPVH